MKTEIHPTAIIEEGAVIGEGCKIGPYCVIGSKVKLGAGIEIKSHVVIGGNTTIGENTVIFPFASIGQIPQDLKYAGEDSQLIIGKNNKIREYVTMQPGTADDKMKTVIGDNCLFMASAHVAHDCIVGNNVIMANSVALAGHVVLGDFVILGGLSAVHQFVRIGDHAMIGGMSPVEHDVIPYGMVKGDRAYLAGLNYLGLERRGFSKDDIKLLLKVFREVFESDGLFTDRVKAAEEEYKSNEAVMKMIRFIKDKKENAAILKTKNNN